LIKFYKAGRRDSDLGLEEGGNGVLGVVVGGSSVGAEISLDGSLEVLLKAVEGHFGGHGSLDGFFGLLGVDGISSENPDLLESDHLEGNVGAGVHDGVVVVVGGNDSVVTGGEVGELDHEVSVLLLGLFLVSEAIDSVPLAVQVVLVLDSDGAVSLEGVAGGVTGTALVSGSGVTVLFVPVAGVGLDVEVLLDFGFLAEAGGESGDGGGSEESRDSQSVHLWFYLINYNLSCERALNIMELKTK